MCTTSLCVMGLPICKFFCLTPHTHTGNSPYAYRDQFVTCQWGVSDLSLSHAFTRFLALKKVSPLTIATTWQAAKSTMLVMAQRDTTTTMASMDDKVDDDDTASNEAVARQGQRRCEYLWCDNNQGDNDEGWHKTEVLDNRRLAQLNVRQWMSVETLCWTMTQRKTARHLFMCNSANRVYVEYVESGAIPEFFLCKNNT